MKKRIMVFGDSNSWGAIAGRLGERFDANTRWPCVMQTELGSEYWVLEEALNGRTTVWDDPMRPDRNGKRHLPMLLESHRPLDLVIVKLGVNDLKHTFGLTAVDVALGVGTLVEIVQQSPDAPQCVVVCPTLPVETESPLRLKFAGAVERASGLLDACRAVMTPLNVDVLDANDYAESSPIDGVHMDETSHRALGAAMAKAVRDVLG